MKKILLFTILVTSIFTFSSAQCDVDGLVFDAVLLDPNGTNNFDTDMNGSADTGDEFIQICNTSGSTIDLSSYSIDDDGSTTTVTYSLSGMLAAGQCMVIMDSYEGTPPANFLILPANSFSLSNNGELLTLRRNDSTLGCVISVQDPCPTTGLTFPCEDWPDSDGIVTAGGVLRPDITPGDLGGSSLPVILEKFSAKKNNQNIHILWTTSTEINNDYFIVQRSYDMKGFERIGKVLGNGTTSEEVDYEFIDRNPIPGMNYYRLAQYDFNGDMEYHKTIAVENRAAKSTVFPTVATDIVNIKTNEESTIRILDLSGKLIQTQLINESDQVDVSGLTPGNYTIQIVTAGSIENHRIIKQ